MNRELTDAECDEMINSLLGIEGTEASAPPFDINSLLNSGGSPLRDNLRSATRKSHRQAVAA